MLSKDPPLQFAKKTFIICVLIGGFTGGIGIWLAVRRLPRMPCGPMCSFLYRKTMIWVNPSPHFKHRNKSSHLTPHYNNRFAGFNLWMCIMRFFEWIDHNIVLLSRLNFFRMWHCQNAATIIGAELQFRGQKIFESVIQYTLQ